MYNSGFESNMIDRESLRQMALAQVYGPSYYSQSSKERLQCKSISQRSHSPRCYSGIPSTSSNCAPCGSMSTGLPHDSTIVAYPTVLHNEGTAITPSGYWIEKDSGWTYGDHAAWKACSQTYPVNLTQGMNKSL